MGPFLVADRDSRPLPEDGDGMPVNGHNGRSHAWTIDEALDAGRRWVERYGEPPSRSDLDPAQIRRRIRTAAVKLRENQERSQRFVEGDMPGTWVIRRLFGGMDGYLSALGFTPRGTGRPPVGLAGVHEREAKGISTLSDGHRWVLNQLQKMGGLVEERELRYQQGRGGSPGNVVNDLDDLEQAGLIESEVRVSYRLTEEGRRRRLQLDDNLGTGVAA
jgi:hypothetical protein